ncbi:MAG: FliM/FliN family flagellar motor C-terminal domain-containing protein [Pseudomonadota bacterium]
MLEHQLRVTFGTAATVRFEAADTKKFGKLDPTPEAATIAVAVTPDGAFSGFATIDNVLAARIIETALGVPEPDPDPPERSMTAVDEALAEPFARDVFACFGAAIEAAWGTTRSSGLRFDRYVSAAAGLLEVEAESDMLDFSVSIALRPDAAPSRFGMTFSLGGLEQLKAVEAREDAPKLSPPVLDPVWSRAMRRAAAGAEIKTVAVLRRVRMNLGEATEMRPGDIIPLSLDGGMNVEVALTGEDAPVVCHGALGAADDRRAVKVDLPPEAELVADVNAVLRGGGA